MRNLGILVLVIIIGAGAFFAGKSSSDDLTTPNQVNSDANIDALKNYVGFKCVIKLDIYQCNFIPT